jgi:hypothetical protein
MMGRWCWRLGLEQCKLWYLVHFGDRALRFIHTFLLLRSNKHSARRAQNILSAMEKLHNAKKSDVKPDLDCYRYVLTAMSRSKVPEVGKNVAKLFKTMEDGHIFPDTQCFDAAIETLMNCASNARGDEANDFSKMAESMLVQMEKEQDRSSVSVVKPSATTYTHVIQALGVRKSKSAAEKADALLRRMESKYAEGDESMKPTRDSYVGTIHAYGNCGSTYSFINANEVLQRMIAQYSDGNESARPDVCSYHAVIRACANAANNNLSPDKEKEALVMAISTVQNMKKSENFHPNAKSYLLLLQCCTNLLPSGNEREKALCSVFRCCCKDGLVSQHALKEFQSAVSNEVYHREVVNDAPSYNGVKALPEKWTRNLGFKVRMQEAEGGKRSPVISVSGAVISSTAYNDYRMRRRWAKTNQKLLQGGRM